MGLAWCPCPSPAPVFVVVVVHHGLFHATSAVAPVRLGGDGLHFAGHGARQTTVRVHVVRVGITLTDGCPERTEVIDVDTALLAWAHWNNIKQIKLSTN